MYDICKCYKETKWKWEVPCEFFTVKTTHNKRAPAYWTDNLYAGLSCGKIWKGSELYCEIYDLIVMTCDERKPTLGGNDATWETTVKTAIMPSYDLFAFVEAAWGVLDLGKNLLQTLIRSYPPGEQKILPWQYQCKSMSAAGKQKILLRRALHSAFPLSK